MSNYIDSRFVQVLNLWNNYLKDNGSVEFYNDDEDDDCETLIIEYKKYEGLPSAYTQIDSMVIYDYLCKPKPYDKLLDGLIIPQTKRLIAGYKNSKEYKESKYYKMDIVKQRIQDIEEDFK